VNLLDFEASNDHKVWGIEVGVRPNGRRSWPAEVKALAAQKVDEIEKAGAAQCNKSQNFNLAESLLPLLEKATAKSWGCPYYEVKFDMLWVNWVLTSNDWRRLPKPLLSRCPPLHLRAVTPLELQGFAKSQGLKRGLGEAAIDAIIETITYLAARSAPQSLRSVLRMIDRAENLEARPMLN
jgi:hypothetical protein